MSTVIISATIMRTCMYQLSFDTFVILNITLCYQLALCRKWRSKF